jgi:hypothetical protein
MKTHTDPLTLSDGATIRVRIERGPTGDAMLHEEYGRHPHGSAIYWRGNRLFLVWGQDRELLPIENPYFEFAETVEDAAKIALAFFALTAEEVIAHARESGIPVEACYAA